MKKYMILLAAAAFMAAACDKVSVDEVVPHEPVVTAFTPVSAPVGAVVTVTGEYLQDVTEAYIGNVKVEIAAKISNTRLDIRVVNGVTSGVVKLVNAQGTGMSDASFNCSFAVPEIAASLLQAEAEMGENIMISGAHLFSVKQVFFTAEGLTEGHEGEIVSRTDDEMIVKVPYVEDASARITMTYFNGTTDVATDLASAPGIRVIRYVPVFNAYEFEKTAVGRSITLTGEYLNNVDRITVGEWEAQVYKSAGELTFTIPAGEFPDGDTVVPLTAWYFD
ncbi:MAG: IPT/TIG domain-containing protein, partial [Bacteroidales bacterium]|nr:IPT/TIG domain-containing protein [Bacteroidales bacterium]